MNRKLVISPNWLGDAVMALPAFQLWRKCNSGAEVSVLAKKSQMTFWKMVPGADEVIEQLPGNAGLIKTASALRSRSFEEAVILPNSFRSALVAFLAGIPERRGFKGQLRSLLLTDCVLRSSSLVHKHQQYEDADIFLGAEWDSEKEPLPPPSVVPSAGVRDAAAVKFGITGSSRVIGIIPGAARGESKRWPYFADAALLVRKEFPARRYIVFGAPGETSLCAEVAAKIGDAAFSVAGETSLEEFAVLLSLCEVVMCNDSGGMHLSTAVGTPAVAVFGLTDYEKTGPLGTSRVIRKDGVKVSRRISPDSPEAVSVLRSIPPEQVAEAVKQFL